MQDTPQLPCTARRIVPTPYQPQVPPRGGMLCRCVLRQGRCAAGFEIYRVLSLYIRVGLLLPAKMCADWDRVYGCDQAFREGIPVATGLVYLLACDQALRQAVQTYGAERTITANPDIMYFLSILSLYGCR
jgi:hypothetical protein